MLVEVLLGGLDDPLMTAWLGVDQSWGRWCPCWAQVIQDWHMSVIWLLRPGQNTQLRVWWRVNAEPQWAAWSLCNRFAQSEDGMMTRFCLKNKPSWTVSSWCTDQYGSASSGTANLSLGHPVRTRGWRAICLGSEEAAALMSWKVAFWKVGKVRCSGLKLNSVD